jgi:hypothetical protein
MRIESSRSKEQEDSFVKSGTRCVSVHKRTIFWKAKEITLKAWQVSGLARRRIMVHHTGSSDDLSAFGVIESEISENGHLGTETDQCF